MTANIYILDLPGLLIFPALVSAHSEYEARHILYNRDINIGIEKHYPYFSNRAHRWLEEAWCRHFTPDVNGIGIMAI